MIFKKEISLSEYLRNNFKKTEETPFIPLWQRENTDIIQFNTDDNRNIEIEMFQKKDSAKTIDDIFPKITKPEYMFVYGTLRKNGKRSSLLEDCKFEGNAVTGINYDLKRTGRKPAQYDFPLLFKSTKFIKGKKYLNRVMGELYIITPSVLEILDGIENIPVMFKREKIPIYKYDLEKNHIKDRIESWAYIANEDYWKNAVLHDCERYSEKTPHLHYTA